MSNHASGEQADSATDIRSGPALPDAIQCTETYQIEEGTVFYDTQNPLAWVQIDTAVRLSDQI